MTFIKGRASLTDAIALLYKLRNKDHRVTRKVRSCVDQIEHNPYLELRKIAFSVTPEHLGWQFPNGSNELYGIITDIVKGPEASTVVTFLNGHASIYLASGDGWIGSRLNDSIQLAVKEFMEIGSPVSCEGTKIEYSDPPQNGTVNFYFLSVKGQTKITESLKKLENGQSKYTKLYSKLNDVITEIKLKAVNKRYSTLN